jgi:hypothetical protein
VAFPTFSAEFAKALADVAMTGAETDAAFVLGVMANYHGEPSTHELLKALVAKYPEDQSILSGVSVSLDNTGVVWGEYGFADAFRNKKAAMTSWLDDERAAVRAFAERHIKSLEMRIVDEHRRAEEDLAMRALQHQDEGKEGDGDEESIDGEPVEPEGRPDNK